MDYAKHINIEVTKTCNQNCCYCFNDSSAKKDKPQLTLCNWISVLEYFHHRGLRSILITGGEPFTWPYTVDLLDSAQRMGIETSILSNGFRMQELVLDRSDVFRQLSVAQISLDAMSSTLHDSRRGCNGAWRQAIEAIEALRSLHVAVEISCTTSKENIGELIAIGNYSKSVGASLLIRPIAKLGRASKLDIPCGFNEHLDAICGQIRKLGINLVNDRFFYVPVNYDIDTKSQRDGFFTIKHNGEFSRSDLYTASGKANNNVLHLAKVA